MSLPVWAVVPASGVGSRMSAEKPKQYLRLGDRRLLEHSLDRLIAHPRVSGCALALAPQDRWWRELDYRSEKPLLICEGGQERLHSVLSALHRLQAELSGDALVLVHDAVRPFLLRSDLDRLIEQAEQNDAGAILATPLADTLKREAPPDSTSCLSQIEETVPRDGLWQALTPQAFRLSLLAVAIEKALDDQVLVTDDASAMERCGYHPCLVKGDRRNIKLTHPEDMHLGLLILKSLEQEDL